MCLGERGFLGLCFSDAKTETTDGFLASRRAYWWFQICRLIFLTCPKPPITTFPRQPSSHDHNTRRKEEHTPLPVYITTRRVVEGLLVTLFKNMFSDLGFSISKAPSLAARATLILLAIGVSLSVIWFFQLVVVGGVGWLVVR